MRGKALFLRILRRYLILSTIVAIAILSASCSSKVKENSIDISGEPNPSLSQAALTGEPKTLLEKAVDWGNDSLFDVKKEYDVFTMQTKVVGSKEYKFLFEQDKDFWSCELYYIQCDEQGNIKKVTDCGGGNVDFFSDDIVSLTGENYVAMYCASHMGNGGLTLFPLDKEDGSTYTIDNVIDNYYEAMAFVDDYGSDYMKSSVYYDGILKAEYMDVNDDGATDIVLTGIILEYIGYKGEVYTNEYGKLTDSQNCKRTYLYNSSTKQFELSEEILDNTYKNEKTGLSWDYTGYLDINPEYAEDNPRYDYDGDGLLDRVYRQFDSSTGYSSFYLYFGDGTKLLLADPSWGIFFKTETADLTGDGVDEILFEQFSTSTKCQNLYIDIFTKKNGTYERMGIPYYGELTQNSDADKMLFLPLEMKKKSDSKVSITQPDTGYKGIMTTQRDTYDSGETDDEMDHLYIDEIEGVIQKYQASEMRLIDTEAAGKKAFLFRSYLGDKWCAKSVDWKLEYLEGEWKITGIYQVDPIRIDVGKKFTADLNGDQTEDTVCYGIEAVKENKYEYEVPFLKINGTKYNDQYLENKFGVSIVDCSKIGYYILDIDTSDSYREIAILDEGLSDDPVTYFFRYTGKDLIYCGKVTDFPCNTTFYPCGDGKIKARKRLSILQTWYADATWKLNDKNLLEEQPSDYYYPYQYVTNENTTNYAKQDLVLYKRPVRNSVSVMIKKGEIINLTATDNVNWVEITSGSGTTGWFFLHDGSEVTLPTGEVKVGNIVTYLNMAD